MTLGRATGAVVLIISLSVVTPLFAATMVILAVATLLIYVPRRRRLRHRSR